ncbi:MAG: VWA domain-containing protein [Hyphomicrobiales bacterium]|nr:VWA domain-containing protein [Hyphomicrobiales bacterium]
MAVIFALVFTAAAAVAAFAIELGQLQNRRVRLQAGVDAAALAVASATQNTSTPPSNAQLNAMAKTLLQQDAGAQAQLAELHACTPSANDCTTTSGTTLQSGRVYLRATMSSPFWFSSLIGMVTGKTPAAMQVGAVSIANSPVATYVDIYVLVDISGSMGLGASPSDQTALTGKYGCAFACHNYNPANPSDTSNDWVVGAANAGITLRLDAIKSSLKAAVARAQSLQITQGSKIRFAFYTFANPFNQILPISSTYGSPADTTPTTIYGAVNSLAIPRYNSGTDMPNALAKMAAIVPATGDGKTQATPKTYVFFATDGTANLTDDQAGGAWVPYADWVNWNPTALSNSQWTSYVNQTAWGSTSVSASIGNPARTATVYDGPATMSGLVCSNMVAMNNAVLETDPTKVAQIFSVSSPCLPQPFSIDYFTKTLSGVSPAITINGTKGLGTVAQEQMMMLPIDPAWCARLRANTNLMTLYTTYYLPAPPRAAYINYLAVNVEPKIAGNMQACASSPAYAFVASDAAGISTSINAMLDTAAKVKLLK